MSLIGAYYRYKNIINQQSFASVIARSINQYFFPFSNQLIFYSRWNAHTKNIQEETNNYILFVKKKKEKLSITQRITDNDR